MRTKPVKAKYSALPQEQEKVSKTKNRRSSPDGQKNSTRPGGQDSANIKRLGELTLSDLFGREAIQVEWDSVRQVITDKVVLVTGAAGSIGSELCRQILEYEPAKLICLDQNETGIFYLQMELCETPVPSAAVYCVEDFTHSDAMRRIFSAHQIQTVFHAAGYKHVPLMEQNLRAALENNVFGLVRFLDICEAARSEAFVLISSDKAVNPTSIMGCTKRLGELILASRESERMRCVSVRFGNVLASQGSVVPIFQKQLAEKRPLTVTHREIKRYFMTVSEAMSLVLQASAIGEHGDILVLDMGEPVRIIDLARAMIRLSGKSERDAQIVVTGLRPGEKVHEDLFYKDEDVTSTSCDRIKRASGTPLSWPELKSQLDVIGVAVQRAGDDAIRAQLQSIIPEYNFEGGAPARSIDPRSVSAGPRGSRLATRTLPQTLTPQKTIALLDASSPESAP